MKCNFMFSSVPRERKKCEWNSVPRSDVTWVGIPCFEKMCMRNNRATSSEVTVSVVGMKAACFVNLSTITNMAVCFPDFGSCSMKSMEMESHGRSGIGRGFSFP